MSTPSNTEVCLCKHALRRRKHWLLAQKISNCFDFTQAVCASVQTTPYTVKMFVQTICLHKLLARVDGVGAAFLDIDQSIIPICNMCIKTMDYLLIIYN